ncbi:hypothetical protein LY76DRAFT_624967 [Colletotrichum caudatum]|nr:hypothetical protein LY76DRAFT_624967 [Colletotrichum caudatum]
MSANKDQISADSRPSIVRHFGYALQVPDYPFDVNGAFEGSSTSTTEFNSGGIIKCNGHFITVPKNLQVTNPDAFIGFKDFVASSSGYTGYNCEVTGNVVNGVYVAARVSFAQALLNGASGYVDKVSFDGSIKLQSGVTIRINDPRAVYSVGYTIQPFFTADDANPSITSFSGFPMCVLRNATDPSCPLSNRPDVAGSKQGTFQASDPLVMAPIVTGDFVEYPGIQAGGEIIVYNLIDVNIGVWTADTADQEIAQARFVGCTSDSSANVNPIKIYAIEYDPCTGEGVDREIAAVNVPSTAARNKFEYRITAPQNDQYAREYRIVAGTGTLTTKNSIVAGQYVMPVSEWIQPEDSVPGRPPTPHDFRSYSFLTKGLGRDSSGQLWGPLDPFPQTGATLFNNSKCAPDTGTGTGTGTGNAPVAPKYKDVVNMAAYSWVNSGGGTLSVDCQSNSTNDYAVSMKISYTNKDDTTSQSMRPVGNGLWKFSASKVKQPTIGSVVCKSGLGGYALR